MSYYYNGNPQQPPVGVPPPQGYPPKYNDPPPVYVMQSYPQRYTPPQQHQPTSFLDGCLAALCCCCLLDACL